MDHAQRNSDGLRLQHAGRGGTAAEVAETDIQPEIQAVHAPEASFLTNLLSGSWAPSVNFLQQ